MCQAEENYNAALALDPSDAGSREGLRAVATARNDLEAGPPIHSAVCCVAFRGYSPAGRRLVKVMRLPCTAWHSMQPPTPVLLGRPQPGEWHVSAVLVGAAGAKALEAGDARTSLWHADLVLRANLPAVETAQLLRVRAMSALGRHAEALAGSRKLSIEGDPAHPTVLSIRAGTLYSAGNMQLAERVYQEVRPPPSIQIAERRASSVASMSRRPGKHAPACLGPQQLLCQSRSGLSSSCGEDSGKRMGSSLPRCRRIIWQQDAISGLPSNGR